MLGDQRASDRSLPLGQRRRLKWMARTQADLATVLVSSQSVAAQMRPELPVPLPTQMALHPIINGVVAQFAARRVQGRAVLEGVHS